MQCTDGKTKLKNLLEVTKKAKYITAVKIKGRYIRFVDYCLSTQKFNTLELNF